MAYSGRQRWSVIGGVSGAWVGRRAVVVVTLFGGMSTVLAQPPPPPNPSDDELRRSQQTVEERATEAGRLIGRLAELDAEADDLAAALAGERKNAEAALVDLGLAQDAAAGARRRAADARVETDAATTAIDAAESSDAGLREQRVRYDDWQRRLAEAEAARQRAERQAAAYRESVAAAASRGAAAAGRCNR